MTRSTMPMCDELTSWEYLTQSKDYISTVLFDRYAIPRPGEPGRLRASFEKLTGPISAEDSWRSLAMALARDYVPDLRPVFPPDARPFKDTLKGPGGGPKFLPGPEPRYSRADLLRKVAEHMAQTGQSMTAALEDLFDESAATPDLGSRRRFFKIKEELPTHWREILAEQQAREHGVVED